MVKTNSDDSLSEKEGTLTTTTSTTMTASPNNDTNAKPAVLAEEGENKKVGSDNISDEVTIEDIGDEDREITPSTINNKEEVSSTNISPKLQNTTTTTNTTISTNNSPNNLQLAKRLKPTTFPKPTKIIKAKFQNQMDEVFAINIRPITASLTKNFFSKEFSVPGGNGTKIYRMESSTLICEMFVNFKFDRKSKYRVSFGALGIMEGTVNPKYIQKKH